MKKKVLVIPHSCDPHVRVRLKEVAYALRADARVYLLSWAEPVNAHIITRATAAVRNAIQQPVVRMNADITDAAISILHRPLSLVPRYNAASLEALMRKEKIDALIQGTHYFFSTPTQRRYPYTHIFDLNDIPAEGSSSTLEKFIHRFARTEARKATMLTCCSHGLVDYAIKNYQRHASIIPNGTHLSQFSTVDDRAVSMIRHQYHLEGKYVIGYIGKVGEWIDTDFLQRLVARIRRDMPNAVLLLVGDISESTRQALSRVEGIICAGGIDPKEITPFFHAIDLGVIPAKKTPFQDMAFHSKLIEYTAARKQVISTDLEETITLGFGNVICCPLDADAWARNFHMIVQRPWAPSWDMLTHGYDWKDIAKKFLALIEGGS